MLQRVALERARAVLRELEAVDRELGAGRPQTARLRLGRIIKTVRDTISEAERFAGRLNV